MRTGVLFVFVLLVLCPGPLAAQTEGPREHTFAAGADVGFLAPDDGESDASRTLQNAGAVDAFIEYYSTARTSLRIMYGWAAPPFESIPDRSLRRQHLNVNFIYNLQFGRFRPFGTVGGGAYFLGVRENGTRVARAVTKPGGTLGWGAEYAFRTFAVKSEMNVHILDTENRLADFDGRTLTAFTWTFGIKVPF